VWFIYFQLTFTVPHGLDHSVLDHENNRRNNNGGQSRLRNVVKAGREVQQGNNHYHAGVEIGQLGPHSTGI